MYTSAVVSCWYLARYMCQEEVGAAYWNVRRAGAAWLFSRRTCDGNYNDHGDDNEEEEEEEEEEDGE